MKAANFIFKIAAIVLAVAAVVCCVLANLEKITDGFLALREQLTAKRKYCCQCDDMDEYEDWGI
jgi:hypothetical protein